MDENTQIMDPEWDVDISDLAGDDTGSAPDDSPEEVIEETTQEEGEQIEPEETQEEQPPAGEPGTPTEEFYELNILGQTQRVSKKDEDVIPVLQKGMDYDRVQGQRDSLRTQVEELTTASNQNKEFMARLQKVADKTNGGDVEAMIRDIRIGLEAKNNGGNVDLARKTIENEDLQAQVSAQNAAKEAQQKANQLSAAQLARQEREVSEFQAAHPDIVKAVNEGKARIPQEVWDDVAYGVPLLRAYDRWAKEQADKKALEEYAAQAATKKQNETNRARAVGSAVTSGQNKQKDSFAAGFDAAFY